MLLAICYSHPLLCQDDSFTKDDVFEILGGVLILGTFHSHVVTWGSWCNGKKQSVTRGITRQTSLESLEMPVISSGTVNSHYPI